MADIVISEFMDDAAVADLQKDFSVLYDPDLVDRADDLRAAVAGCRALIVRNRTQVRGSLLDAAPGLEAVGRLGVGLDNIDLDACAGRSIAVLPATGANDVSVAEYVIAGLLMLLRGAYFSSAQVAAGDWPRNRLIGREAAGRCLGLCGFGGTARAVAVRARGLGMTVQAYDPAFTDDDPVWTKTGVAPAMFEEILSNCDVISLHVPLLDSTRHMIDAGALALMKPDAIVINAARGGVVDETALVDALRAGKLGGAMLDVFENEPLASGSGLGDVPGLILTPHIAGLTDESNARVGSVTAENVRRVLKGNT